MILKKLAFIPLVLLLGCVEQNKQVETKKYTEDWESLAKANTVPEWFQDAKFGIYAHWGPVSQVFEGAEKNTWLGGWHGMTMYENKGVRNWVTGEVSTNKDGTPNNKPSTNYTHHVNKYGDPAEFDYKYLIERFDPSGFNAKEWADLFALSGAKFAGPVAIHHDNFAMWNSEATRWNSVKYGNVDVSGELKKEIEAHGMKYMASFHHAFTWMYWAPAHEYFDIDPADYDLYTDKHAYSDIEPSKEFYDQWWAILKEFIDVYEPDLIWFDWWLENMNEETRKMFLAYYYNKGEEWGKDVAVCFKETTFPEETAIRDYERGRPNQPKKRGWLTDTSPGAWFYRANAKFVSANDLVDILIDIVAKNGNMLLNVPPDPDGTIPQVMVDLLTEMGAWLEVNGEAIYKTRVWNVFGEGPTRLPDGGHKVEKKKIVYTNKDIRFTKGSEDVFYAIVMDKPGAQLEIKSLGSQLGVLNAKIESIELLGSDEDISWERTSEALVIKSPKNFPTDYAHAYKIILEGYKEVGIGGGDTVE